jgi:hypothetical protein
MGAIGEGGTMVPRESQQGLGCTCLLLGALHDATNANPWEASAQQELI